MKHAYNEYGFGCLYVLLGLLGPRELPLPYNHHMLEKRTRTCTGDTWLNPKGGVFLIDMLWIWGYPNTFGCHTVILHYNHMANLWKLQFTSPAWLACQDFEVASSFFKFFIVNCTRTCDSVYPCYRLRKWFVIMCPIYFNLSLEPLRLH